MSIRFACPCGQELEAEPDHAGLSTECPHCRRELQIPTADSFLPAVRKKSAAVNRPRPPLTNRFNDDGSLARPRGEPDGDDVRRRPHRAFDDDVHDEDHDDAPTGRPRMRTRPRDDTPTGVNWNMVGGGALVVILAAAWGIASWLLGGFPVYQAIACVAGLVAVVKGLMGHQRD